MRGPADKHRSLSHHAGCLQQQTTTLLFLRVLSSPRSPSHIVYVIHLPRYIPNVIFGMQGLPKRLSLREAQRVLSLHPHASYRPSLARATLQQSSSFSSRSTSHPTSSQFNRSDFTSQPYTGSYEPDLPTAGPLGSAPSFGAPRITPKVLKQYLDQYVVGQDRAKKSLCVAVYNHYQRAQELQRREDEMAEQMAKRMRRKTVESASSVAGNASIGFFFAIFDTFLSFPV